MKIFTETEICDSENGIAVCGEMLDSVDKPVRPDNSQTSAGFVKITIPVSMLGTLGFGPYAIAECLNGQRYVVFICVLVAMAVNLVMGIKWVNEKQLKVLLAQDNHLK